MIAHHEVGWLALAMVMAAAVFKANLKRAGWLVGIVGNLLWIVAYWGDMLVVITNVLFTLLYLYGWLKWSGGKVSFIFAWYDAWIGLFWDAKKRWLYVLPIPMCGIIIKFKLCETKTEKAIRPDGVS